MSKLTLTEQQAAYIADYIEYEYSEKASELTLTGVILEAIESINGGAIEKKVNKPSAYDPFAIIDDLKNAKRTALRLCVENENEN